MLNKITAVSQWASLDPLELNITDRPETDLFEVRDIQGLGPVKADVSTTKLGSHDGEILAGLNVGKRNIVLTLGITPDWDVWDISKARGLLSRYFMPKQLVLLTFDTSEFSPVGIYGYVESNEPNMFNKDPEQQISVICPELYFKAILPTVIEGVANDPAIPIDYEGTIETGFTLVVNGRTAAGTDPTWVKVQVNDPLENSIQVESPITLNENFEMSSIAGDKHLRQVDLDGDIVENLFHSSTLIDNNDRNSRWPRIGPGLIDFAVTSQAGSQDWTLTYYDLFGSL